MKFLVIDDEPLVRRSLHRALAAKGHTVIEAADGLQGLQSWKEQDPDVVFVDVLMPGLKGPEVIREMTNHRAKVILMTAYSGEEILSETNLPVSLFVKKPFEDIFEIVQKAEGLVK